MHGLTLIYRGALREYLPSKHWYFEVYTDVSKTLGIPADCSHVFYNVIYKALFKTVFLKWDIIIDLRGSLISYLLFNEKKYIYNL